MFYSNELSFLCEVLRKSRIGAQVLRVNELKDLLKKAEENEDFDLPSPIADLIPTLEPNTVYRLVDSYERNFRILLLPNTQTPTVLLVGPFLASNITHEQILELGEQLGISPQKQHLLSELYMGIPVLHGDSPHFAMFDTFCERIWKGHAFNTKDISPNHPEDDTPLSRTMRNLEHRDTLLSIKAMAQRYAIENEMIRAVSLGKAHLESKFDTALSSNLFEKRLSDPVRNTKNYMIIMNTLLRKAAEKGGVHPIYIDQVSSDFARKIENLSSLSGIKPLMSEMFRTYSRLVRHHSLKDYAPIVQSTILIIDADLSADLSAGKLAEAQSVSLGYLSTVFKKETGQTISEYVRKKRMEYAAYLLQTTVLQIQTVALHCGIMDVQYFSKLFKAHHQKTPTEYRKSIRGSATEN